MQFSEFPGEWYAVHVKSRHEKMVVGQLEARGIVNWLPLIERRKKWSDRYKLVNEPLFAGYVFTGASDPSEIIPVLETRGVVRIIGSGNRPYAIPPSQLQSVWSALQSKLVVDPYPHLVEGTPVRVKRGPMMGTEGILVEKRKKHLFVLSVEMIGQSIALEIDADNLEAA